MFKKQKSNEIRAGIGVFTVLGVGIVIIALLFLNGLFVSAFLHANAQRISDLRLTQAIQFLVPLILIIVEFWIFDRMNQNLRK